jgi:sulfite reductase beta subunit-like hemoprotein
MSNKVEEIKKEKDGLDVWPDLLRYSKTGYASITPEDMSRLRWYGIYEQQPKEGYFMLRVKIPGGDISAAQWRALGEIARDYGRGIADITTRQNVQFHWLTVETIPAAIEKMNSVGLTTVGACGDITRNVAGCPVAGIDPNEIYDARHIIEEATRYFLGNREFSDLPRKYKMTIAGCGHQCHQPQINDLGLVAVRRPVEGKPGEFETGFHVYVGGGLSTQPHLGPQIDAFIKPEQALDVCRAVTEIFRDYGYRERRNRARLKFLVADWGPEKFREVLIQKLGWTPDPAVPQAQLPNAWAAHSDHVGVHAQKQPGLHWIGAAVLTGRLTAEKMLAAADVADRFCDGVVRTTNQQNLLFPNIATEDLDEAKAALKAAGYLWDVSTYRRASIACTGTEFCNLAITETKLRLTDIIEHLESSLPIDESIRINVNGCPNACGQHYTGDIGLQGCLARVGDEKVEAYDICLGGRLGIDAKFTRPISRKVPATKIKFALENLVRAYQEERTDEENFGLYVDRHTDDELGERLGLHLLAEDDPDFVPPPARHAPAGVE